MDSLDNSPIEELLNTSDIQEKKNMYLSSLFSHLDHLNLTSAGYFQKVLDNLLLCQPCAVQTYMFSSPGLQGTLVSQMHYLSIAMVIA